MKYIVILLSLSLLLLSGCDLNVVNNEVKDTGPLTIAIASFDYHQTLKRSNGEQFEFYHCEWDGTLANVGAIVDIKYTGGGETMADCAKIVGVTVITPSNGEVNSLRESQLKDKATKLLTENKYYEIDVMYRPHGSDYVAQQHHYDNCDITYQAQIGGRLSDGLVCETTKNGVLKIVVTETF